MFGVPMARLPRPDPLPAGASGKTGRVHIARDHYFDGVPGIASGFPIGHYQKIVRILAEADRVMQEIELPLGE